MSFLSMKIPLIRLNWYHWSMKFPLIEDLEPHVVAIGDKQAAPGVERQAVGNVELPGGRALLSPRLDELPVLVELDDAGVAVAAVAVGDEDVAVGIGDDVGRLIERVRTIAGNASLPQRQQHLAVGTELEHLMSDRLGRRRRR